MSGQLAAVEILRVNRDREQHQVGKHILLEWCRRMIGADTVDVVDLRDGRVMLIDDLGHQKQLHSNAEATKLYHSVCRPGTTHQIVGDVAVCWDEDFA